MHIGAFEIIVILLVILLLFGAKRIPDLARALGKASYEFKKAKQTLEQESQELMASAEKNAELSDRKTVDETGKDA
ncbi:MAG: twin-arginine translocase TatA/TatE family subunit [Lentisphaeria bacterium]|nr:twin-arginine translocase TatA/TatE family subunit [Lentisphaeria bacterium]